MDRDGNVALSYHRRRAAQEQGLSEGAAGLAAAQSHRELAALHGEQAARLTPLVEARDEIVIATPA